MEAALAVVRRRVKTSPIIVIEHEMLALETDDVRKASEIAFVLGDNE